MPYFLKLMFQFLFIACIVGLIVGAVTSCVKQMKGPERENTTTVGPVDKIIASFKKNMGISETKKSTETTSVENKPTALPATEIRTQRDGPVVKLNGEPPKTTTELEKTGKLDIPSAKKAASVKKRVTKRLPQSQASKTQLEVKEWEIHGSSDPLWQK